MITYINPDAIEDQSIDWSKLKNVPEFPLMVNVTYGELKALRDSAELIPGQQYRIIDYVTTTSQENTTSAGHQFDIIVTADSESTLNEKARACLNENDVYFSNSNAKLEAWQIWYCLDNDNNRFYWADDTSGESIIGTIKPATGVSASGTYTYDTPISKVTFYGTYGLEIGVRTMINSGPPVYITKTDAYTLVVEEASAGYIAAGSGISVYGIVSHVGKGVIYRMIDEWGNDCPYDFKNIIFQNKRVPNTNITTDVYTFTWVDEDYNVIDASIFGNDGTLTYYGAVEGVYNNVIKPYTVDYNACRAQKLNNITFISDASYEGSGNEGFNGCNRNSFGNDCYNNSFGNYCNNNSFGNYCHNNSFGCDCCNNSFGNNCSNNSFGNNCNSNSFVIDEFRAALFNDQASIQEIDETNE